VDLKDFLKMPLLKGGGFGMVGTAPLVFAAAKTMEKVTRAGGAIGSGGISNWKELLDNYLGSSSDAFLEEKMKIDFGTLSAIVECPECHRRI
jgi:hypothetical protein